MARHRITRSLARRVLAVLLAVLSAAPVTLGSSVVSRADDEATLVRDLASAGDFRVRVAAALALGKLKTSGARAALSKALKDAHPAVRAAAAAALGALGDAAALPALRAALAREASSDVKAQIDTTIKRLVAAQTKPKFVLVLGKLEDKSGVSSAAITGAFRTSTRARMMLVAGVDVLADGADVAAEGKSRNLPAFALDGSLTKLEKRQADGGVGYAARVEYVIRKMPDQILKGTMNGAAQAMADIKQIRGAGELEQLKLDAMDAAVESALKSAGPTLQAASR